MKNLSLFVAVGVVLIFILILSFMLLWPGEEDRALPPEKKLTHGDTPEKEEIKTIQSKEMIPPESLNNPNHIKNGKAHPEFEIMKVPGWPIWGVVKNTEGNLLQGAEVRLWYRDHEEHGPFMTDENGVYTANLPLPKEFLSLAPNELFRRCISGRALASGHQPCVSGCDYTIPSPFSSLVEDKVIRIDFEMKKGAVLQGRVLTSDFKPASRAILNIQKEDKSWKWEYCKRVSRRRTNTAGLYTLPIEEAGQISVYGAKFGAGAGKIGPIQVDPNRDIKAPDIVLENSGQLEGTVIYPNGQPVRDIPIYATSEEMKGRLPNPFNDEDYPMDGLNDNKGLSFGWANTGKSGDFRISGLQQGRYVLSPLMWSNTIETLYETGTRNIRIVVDWYRIKVILRNEEGRLIPKAEFAYQHESGRSGAGDANWGETDWKRILPGKMFILASSDKRKGAKWITVSEGNYETIEELILSPPPEPEKLLVSVKGPEGEPIRSLDLCFKFESVIYGAHYSQEEEVKDQPGNFLVTAPIGRYDLEIETHDKWCQPFVKKGVEIISGQKTLEDIIFQKGGFVRLKFMPSNTNKKISDLHIEVVSEDRDWSRSLYVFFASEKSGPDNWVKRADLKPNTLYRSADLLKPGNYRLKVKEDGIKPTEYVFQILPGRFADVDVWWDAE